MPEAQWFDVQLENLTLVPRKARGWPAAMKTVKSRMCEECLESLVALNLERLFPGEQLLLVATQSQISPMADVIALDMLGTLRLMELKKTPVRRDELEDQVLSYGVAGHDLHRWQDQLARATTDLPDRLALMIEGFRCNERAKTMSAESDQGGTRFEKLAAKVAALRASRGAAPPAHPLKDRAVTSVCDRLYGCSGRDLAWGEPAGMTQSIVERQLRCVPDLAGVEFTLIAPGIADAELDAPRLEKRRVRFNLIDADLRCDMRDDGVRSAVLQWQPAHRSVSSELLLALTKLKHAMLDAGEAKAAGFAWMPHRNWFHWPHLDGMFMWLEEDDGTWYLSTWAEWITEGLADLKPKLRKGLESLAKELSPLGIGLEKGQLWAVLNPLDMRAATALTLAYHKLATDLGFNERFRWQRRPR